MGKDSGKAMRQALVDKREAFRSGYMKSQKRKKGSIVADCIATKGGLK
jgi:uncharacterized protein (DUF2461 family)